MLKILTVVGARPQIIKAAALSRAIRNHFPGKVREVIVHTGQHYDENMSQVFFDELDIPKPDYNLNVGSATHGKQTAEMLIGIEEVLMKERPNALVLYGDTNSTLAGAMAGAKLNIPVVHIEAGLRSFNRSMPEEINRIVCDHVSALLFSPTMAGFKNLVDEGFSSTEEKGTNVHGRVYHCGDVMYDNSLYFSKVAQVRSTILKENHLQEGDFVLATVHRNNNTDEPQRLNALFSSFHEISVRNNIKIVLPLHPRTAKLLVNNLTPELYAAVKANPLLKILPPVSFLEMIALEKGSKMVMTDSGGVQKEAYFFNKPCIILRSETEWTELVEAGAAVIADADQKKITEAYAKLTALKNMKFPPLFGDGEAASFIIRKMLEHLKPS